MIEASHTCSKLVSIPEKLVEGILEQPQTTQRRHGNALDMLKEQSRSIHIQRLAIVEPSMGHYPCLGA